jgi:FAD/FMN-containing dehydrogenase
VIGPGDADYEKLRTVHAGGIDRRPAVIVRVENTEDVARVIDLARETGLALAVRSGGHSSAGHSTTEGGIVLDLGDVRTLEIDAKNRTAWAGAGLTAVEYTRAAHEHGLVTGFGDTGSVGIGGITTGGGVGYFVRKFGLTIDDLLAADVVTADGKLLRADENTNPDLFWALRGGGGNFGVATRFQYRMHPVKKVFGGMLLLPATAAAIAGFMAAAEAAPEELSGIANIMPAPPMPFLAEEHHGKLIIMAELVYAGEGPAAEAALAPFRSLAAPLADMLKPMPYPEIYPPDDPNYRPMTALRTMFIDSVDTSTAALMLDRLNSAPVPFAVTQLRVLGGAMARVPVEATAFAHRSSRILVNLVALYGKPEEKEPSEAWVTAYMAALRQKDAGAYVNFLGDEGPQRVRAAYPSPTWERLVSIKKKYDPANLFRLNQNIPPV